MILLIYTKDIVYTYIIAKLEVLFVKKYITINSFILTVISFLFVEIILFPNILYEAIPYQSYKLINNKEILPFEKVWYDVWKNINNLTIREQITITTYIVNYINPDFTPAYIVRGMLILLIRIILMHFKIILLLLSSNLIMQRYTINVV